MQYPQSTKYKWVVRILGLSVLALRVVKKSVVGAILLGSVAACSERHELDDSWQSYQSNLSQLTNEPAPAIELTAMPIMPRSDDLRIDIERLSIGLLDSLRLDRCRLGQVVAQRNSALGHAQQPAARLRYELDSMLAIEECLHSGTFDDERISNFLNHAFEQKSTTLPLYIDQVLTRSEEFRRSMRANNRTHPTAPTVDFEATYAALDYLSGTFESALQDHWQDVDLQPYNSHLQTLMQSDYLPRHWRTMQRSAAWLNVMNVMLETVTSRDQCEAVANDDTVMQAMLDRFATDIQPHLARWTEQQQKLTPLLRQLQSMSVQGQWRAYIDELIAEGSHAEQVSERTAKHIELWLRTIELCTNARAGS